MILTDPDYIDGDNLSLKQYFAAVFKKNTRLVYSSVWKWWKKTTIFWCVPLLASDLAMFISLVYQDWHAGEGYHWGLIFGMLFIPFIYILPFVWTGYYYQSFTGLKKVSRRLHDFFTTYVPDATNIRRLSYTNYVYRWNGYEFEVAYSQIPQINAKEKQIGCTPSYIICLYIVPEREHEAEIMDAQGQLRTDFIEQINSYCEHKESCRTLHILPNQIFAFFPLKSLQDKQIIMNAMEQMQYLTQRFHLVPLQLHQSAVTRILRWLEINDRPFYKDMAAFYIGLFEKESGYSLYLCGNKTYDPEDEDWICNADFEADEKYLDLSEFELVMDTGKHMEWEDFLLLVKDTVIMYLEKNHHQEKSMFYRKVVTIGFDDGDLEVIADEKGIVK